MKGCATCKWHSGAICTSPLSPYAGGMCTLGACTGHTPKESKNMGYTVKHAKEDKVARVRNLLLGATDESWQGAEGIAQAINKIYDESGPIESITILDRGIAIHRTSEHMTQIVFDDTLRGGNSTSRGMKKAELRTFIECLQMVEAEMQ